MPAVLVALLSSYLLGAVPFGYVTVRIMKGVDITEYGSGVTGATNVSRLLGPVPAVLVAVLDVAKGVLAVTIGRALVGSGDTIMPVLCGLAAMAGHNYSPYLRFKGGKGVATGAGVMLALMPTVTVVAVAVFILVAAVTRYVSLGSMVGSIAAVGAAFVLRQPLPYEIFTLFGSLFIIFRHQANIRRLVHGKEARLGERVRVE